MEPASHTAERKRKKYTKRLFLTVNKKSKRYRESRSCESAAVPHLGDDSFTSDSMSDNETLTEAVNLSFSEHTSSQEKVTHFKDISFNFDEVHNYTKCQPKSKGVQVKTTVKNSSAQVLCGMKSRSVQAVENKCVRSCGIQTEKVPKKKSKTKKNTCGELLKNRLLHQCKFELFAEKLYENEQTEKFVKCICSFASGKLPFTNMAWKSFLDMGALISCTSTTNMEYDKEWLELCQVLYHMFGGGVINALRGKGHFSQVACERTKRGKYDPVHGEFNFPIPSIPTLKKLDIGFPTEIPVGFVEHSLVLAQKKASEGGQFVLSFDGKLIAPGCKGDSTGDSNLWGKEGPPNLKQSVNILNRTLNAAKDVAVDMNNTSSSEHFFNCKSLVNVCSRQIKKLRGKMMSSFYSRKKLVEKCGDSAELLYKNRKKMSSLNQNTAECESVVRRLLEVNLKITSVMAFLNNNGDVHIGNMSRHINLSERGNCFQLLPPEIVMQSTDLDNPQNMQFIKQCSDKWFALRKCYRVTGSTINSAIGLDTLQKQKDHHYEHVRGRKPPPVPPDLQKKFDHGTRNEVNATATLLSTVVPAYLPACYAFYKVGPTFINAEDRDNLLEVSADGLLQCSFGKDCPNYHIHGDRRILVEMKSPVPQENIAETIFYEVPSRYIAQVQAQLKAYMCNELWFVCSIAISATVIVVHFDEKLWTSIWDIIVDLYMPEKPKIPTRLHPNIKQLRCDIIESKSTHTSFLCEVPMVTGEYGTVTIPNNFTSPYAPAPGCQNILKTNDIITEENHQISMDAKCAFKQCHEVLRDPGKELLVLMLTDKDRKQTNNVPYSYPIAYALKGSSMSNSHLRFLVDKVREELLSRQIPVLCEAYDGQWHKFITQNCEGQSLTLLHGRENWNKFASLSKDKCIEHIAALSVVKRSTLHTIKEVTLHKSEKHIVHEICIEKGRQNEIYLSSEKGKMKYLHSVHPSSRPDLYTQEQIVGNDIDTKNSLVVEKQCYVRADDGYKYKKTVKYKYTSVFVNADALVDEKKKGRGRLFGLQENEDSLLDVLNTKAENQAGNEEEVDTAVDMDNQQRKISLEEFLRSDECPLLGNILNELTNANTLKWEGKTVDDLLPGLLNNGTALQTELTVKELNIICLEMHCATG